MRISACLIVKDETAVIDRCLSSLVGFDEIVVCDTGSTDDTIAKALAHGAKVYTDYLWNDDYAEARNHAADKATNDWVFYLSADEYLPPGAVEQIKALPDEGEAYFFSVKMDGDQHTHKHARVYRKYLRFVGKVHEALIVSKDPTSTDLLVIHESGPNHHRDKDFDIRALLLSEKSARNCYYLAREYFYRENWRVAELWFQNCIAKSMWPPERSDAYLYLARCQWYQSKGDEARDNCLNAILINPEFQEAFNFMAAIVWPEQAESWRKYARMANNVNVLFIRG